MGSVEPLVVEDAESDPAFAALPGTAALGIRGYVGVPVFTADGAVFGTLCGIDRTPHPRRDEEIAALQVLSQLVAFHLAAAERARMEGVLLAATTAQHEANNRLAPTVGYLELALARRDLPSGLREPLAEAYRCAREAAALLTRLAGVTRVIEHDWGAGIVTIDLARSAKAKGS